MEYPNLNYINQIAAGDLDFQQKLIQIIKTEFPQETKAYQTAVKENNLIKIAESVHKLKHKISIFGLMKAYEIASEYENQLRNGTSVLGERFAEILKKIEDYLKEI